ncbi:MAG TPA: NAD-dependent epimerase/dehydratase family protein [Chloroflexota bacterium]|nr:NAD-dependent epimerase/dehydratase family protein [Chloroflexota bacterium]
MTRSDLWRDRNVLVTGCTGLLGSWLSERLVSLGANEIGLVRDVVPHSRFYSTGLQDRVAVVRGEVEDRSCLERTLNEYEVQTVFHLAAQTIVGIANRDPISTFEANIRGTWNLLEACRRVSTVRQIVVASSDKAYGGHDVLPYQEDFPLRGRHPYDVSKSCADLIALAYAATYGLPVVVTRCGNFYGGGDLNFNRIVPGTIRSALRGERPIIRSDGTFTRDYIYVEDAATAYIALVEKLADDPSLGGMAFNFSCEQPMSVMDLTLRVLETAGRSDLQPIVLNEASNEIPHQYLDARLAREILGWRPCFTLDDGLARTVEWYRAYFATRDGSRTLRRHGTSTTSAEPEP